MNRIAFVLAASLAAATLSAQEHKTLAQTMDASLSGAEKELVPAVEAMPDAQFIFAPTQGKFEGVRTFAKQAKHVAAVNYMVAAAILGEKAPAEVGEGDGPAAMEAKAEVVAYLKNSYTYAHKALSTLTEKNALEGVKAPFGSEKMSRLTLANILLGHTFDHYGQIVVYLRMNGIVPPASR
jgi:uncharacterized damage-inducible protein DinB